MSRRRKNDNTIHNNSNGKPINRLNQNKEFKPKTPGQVEYVRAIIESDIIFCTGPAGSGKTACAVGIACEHLRTNKIKKIVISRPVIETGRQGLGFLPGTMENKIHPYLIPMLEEMYIYLGRYNVENMIKNETIVVAPLEYIRRKNLHQSFIILDEAQNVSKSQIKMLLTRIGNNSTIVIAGDIDQSDLYDEDMGLKWCINRLNDVRGVSIVQLSHLDIIRNSIISRILAKLE